jgi:hypothetical protein
MTSTADDPAVDDTESIGQQGAVMMVMLAVVVMLALGIGASLTWVESGIISVSRAEVALQVEESLIAALRIAAVELGAHTDCASWGGGVYPLNARDVEVTCVVIDQKTYVQAVYAHHWVHAEIQPGVSQGQRWRLVRWVFPD